MFGTIIWRLREAIDVFFGKKKTVALQSSTQPLESKPTLSPEKFLEQNKELAELINATSIEFCFSEFGETRTNAGGNHFAGNRLDPSLSTLKKYFPNAKYTVYSDFDLKIEGVQLRKIDKMPFENDGHPRYLYRIADYFKFRSLIESDADFVCVLDSDMFVASSEIYRLVYLTQLFGACTAYNVRNLLKTDMEISLDTKSIVDLSNGYGHSFNQSPMTLRKNFEMGKKFYEACCKWMIKEPSRASRVMWKASQELGYSPYLLPQQFCVCTGQEGIGNEILLHVGHKSVAEYYQVNV